jgi:hypothetical protein
VYNSCRWLCDTLWEIFNVVRGVYKGQKTLYHVWLDSMSSVYIALGKETVSHILADTMASVCEGIAMSCVAMMCG